MDNQIIQWAQILHIYQPPGWTPKVIRRVVQEAYEPLITNLEKLPDAHITLNITASLTEQLVDLGFNDLLKRLGALASSGQVEFLTSAAYHPILPLLPDAEIHRQIDLNHEINKSVFGEAWSPKGFWPPELAVSERLFHLLKERGLEYVVASDLAYDGKLSGPQPTTRYVTQQSDMTVVFRSRKLSDAFLDSCVRDEHTFHDVIGRDHTAPIVTAVDGENLGHHRKEMDEIWLEVMSSDHFTTLTLSELLAQARGKQSFPLHHSSWSSREDELANNIPFGLWQHPNNPIHQLLWQLTNLAINSTARSTAEAREALDRALNSDHYWWASAEPWWSVELITQGAQRLERVIELGQNTQDASQAKQLVKKITETSQKWQANGTAALKKQQVSAYYKHINFFGGEQIT